MKIQRFTIPFRLPGLNEVIGKNRSNPFAGASLKSRTDADIQWAIVGIRPVKAPCIVMMVFTEPNKRRDVDNVESAKKFVLDAMVKKGVLQGDGRKYVIGDPSFTRRDNGPAKVDVTIVEDEDVEELWALLGKAEAILGGDGVVP